MRFLVQVRLFTPPLFLMAACLFRSNEQILSSFGFNSFFGCVTEKPSAQQAISYEHR